MKKIIIIAPSFSFLLIVIFFSTATGQLAYNSLQPQAQSYQDNSRAFYGNVDANQNTTPHHISMQDYHDFMAISASFDEAKTKYKNDAYQRKALQRMNFEILLLLGEIALPNPLHADNSKEILPEQWTSEMAETEEDNHIHGPAAFTVFYPTDKKVNSFLNIGTGLRFNGRGDNEINGGNSYKTSIYYLTLPVYIQYNYLYKKSDFFAGIGPYYAYALFGKYVNDVGGETSTDKMLFGKKYDQKRGDIGLGAIIGVMTGKILGKLSYDYGLRSINYDKGAGAFTRAFGISVGYIFK